MRKTAVIALAVLLLAPLVAVASDKAEAGALPAGQARVDVAISGMTCGACCTKVEAAVKDLAGVVAVKADYAKGLATVTYKTDEVNVDKIVATINEKTSFKAKAPEAKKA
ncbi:MAG TPA: heavy-metal-associated domain-containing protein [Candidatus Polarisedimenticolaceae bacterium]|nr:heavy-metal-associated domain-containing protein [Candidatus Polarisedimenticolaceae bacterium]